MDGLNATSILTETDSVSPAPHLADCVDLPFSEQMYRVLRRAARAGTPKVYRSVPAGPNQVAHLSVLRAMPGLAVLRPADQGEILAALRFAARRADGPTLILLCRPTLRCHPGPPAGLFEDLGGWVVREPETFPELLLLSSGAELAGTLLAAKRLARDGVDARVISVPWRERFFAQRPAVLRTLLPQSVPRLVVEHSKPDDWWPLVGARGAVLGGDCAIPAPRQSAENAESERIRAVGHDVLVGAAHGW